MYSKVAIMNQDTKKEMVLRIATWMSLVRFGRPSSYLDMPSQLFDKLPAAQPRKIRQAVGLVQFLNLR